MNKKLGDQNMSNEQTEVVKQLDDMLQYQAASVVSRVLLKNKGGTVTLFAFSKAEGLSEHTAPFDALVHVIEGEAEIGIAPSTPRADDDVVQEKPNINGTLEKFRVRAGEIIILPANRAHAVMAQTDFKMLLIMIRA
jgi:quercetin dioxygenase-like cupin family protein